MRRPTAAPIVLEFDRLALGGDGVGRAPDGKVVFAPGALPGETARVQPIKEKKRYIKARLLSVLSPSPARRALDCAHETQDGCGGCGLRHVSDARSLALKVEAAAGELAKLAPDQPWPAPRLHADAGPLDGARHRARLLVDRGQVGLRQRASHRLAPIGGCLALPEALREALPALEAVLRQTRDEPAPDELLIELRGQRRFVAWPTPLHPHQRAALEALIAADTLAGVRASHGADALDLGDPWMPSVHHIDGQTLTYTRQIGTFGQANPHANQRLLERVHAHLAAATPQVVVDLYAGSGNLTLVAALRAPRVLAVELDPDALRSLTRSLTLNDLPGVVEVRARDLRSGLDPALEALCADTVVLDPPRAGAQEIIAQLARANPRHILYVACSPAHMARDAQALAPTHAVTHLEAFDMFPRTPHLELLAVFSRRDA